MRRQTGLRVQAGYGARPSASFSAIYPSGKVGNLGEFPMRGKGGEQETTGGKLEQLAQIRLQPKAIVTQRDGGVPALNSSGPDSRLLIPTFSLGRSYYSSLHGGLRRLIKSWLPDSLPPDVTIQGVPDEYRSLVEARVVESERDSLLFLINRSGYDWEVDVQPRGYQAERVRLPTHGAARRLVRRMGH